MKFLKPTLLALAILPTLSFGYHIEITEPSEERAYHRPAQTIEVKAEASGLEAGFTTAILLNGQVIGDGLSASVATVDLVPNAYTLEAIVMDKKAQTVARDTRTIHVIQTNQIQRKKKAAIAQWQEYDNSSIWHKIAVGLNPKVQAPPKVDESTPTWELRDLPKPSKDGVLRK